MDASERAVADDPALLIDLYQLTMAASYFAEGRCAPATFSFFVRAHPCDRGYLVAAGLEDVLRYLEDFRFSAAALEHLERRGGFGAEFLNHLRALRFTGEVWAQPEGTLCFAGEPLLEITAPLIEAQLVETYVINQLNLQTMIATKAARCGWAACGRALVDFSLRRTQGTDAGMKVARASYIAGFAGSSNVLAEKHYGVPAFGTMAHSFVEAFADEGDAFRAFARAFPAGSTFLVDTYDTLEGLHVAARVGREMAARGERLRSVRLDSGDLVALSRAARQILDAAGLAEVRIFASGGLNEYKIAALLERGACIDAFGVGTDMGVSGDAPWLDCAYKLVEYAGAPRLKLSAGKETLVGRKQVWRAADAAGGMAADVVALRDEVRENVAAELGVAPKQVRSLLHPVMRNGRIVEPPPALAAIRERCAGELAALADAHKALRQPAPYPVRLSTALQQRQAAATAALRVRLDQAARRDGSG